jgi:hypothetical protein
LLFILDFVHFNVLIASVILVSKVS